MGDKAKLDLKESFIWGYQYDDGSLPDNHQLRGLNKWPEFRPSLQKNAMNYFNQTNELAKSLLTCFAVGLNLREDFFIRNCTAPLSRACLFMNEQFGVMIFYLQYHVRIVLVGYKLKD